MTQGGYPGIGRATEGLVAAVLGQPGEHRFSLIHRTDRPIPATVRQAIQPPHRLLGVAHSLRDPRDQFVLPRVLRGEQVDLFHATYFAVPLVMGCPYVLTIHDLIPERFPGYWSRAEAVVIRSWLRVAARSATRLIVPSEATSRDVVRRYCVAPREVTVTPWGPSPMLLATGNADEREQGNVLLCVCTNKPHKNLRRLVYAYRRAASSQGAPFPELVIAGGWDARYAGLERFVEETQHAGGSVQFVHNPDDTTLWRLYRQARAFVFPSEYEGFGLPVLEAMQAGLPIAASSAPSVRELALDAYLQFAPRDVEEMARAIRQVVENQALRNDLRRRALDRAEQFSWEATANKTRHAYWVALCA